MLNPTDYEAPNPVVESVLRFFGFTRTEKLLDAQLGAAWRATVLRESTDQVFRDDEIWLVVVGDSKPFNHKQMEAMLQLAIGARAAYVALVRIGAHGTVAQPVRARLATEGIQLVAYEGAVAEAMLAEARGEEGPVRLGQLREAARGGLGELAGRFQSQVVLPVKVLPLHRRHAVDESDLVRVLRGGSGLLLGEPGAGKTTNMQALAAELARAGGRTPLYVRLADYRTSLWELLTESAGSSADPLLVRALVEAGALVLLLDGLNEVQDPDRQRHLVEELNLATEPGSATARACWLVSGRVHDYDHGDNPHRLLHLQSERWELQPLTSDLKVQYLQRLLGKDAGTASWTGLSRDLRELCGNPLLLTMLAEVRRSTGALPERRHDLYRLFIELLLHWKDDGQAQARFRSVGVEGDWDELRLRAATALTGAMRGGLIAVFHEARAAVAAAFPAAHDPEEAARVLLEHLKQSGLVLADAVGRLRFRHHTFLEYFQALRSVDLSVEELVPGGEVTGVMKEALLFVAPLHPQRDRLVQAVVKRHPSVAAQLVLECGDVGVEARAEVMLSVLQQVGGGGIVGARRRWAQWMVALAGAAGQTVVQAVGSVIHEPEAQRALAARVLRELGRSAEALAVMEEGASAEYGRELRDSFDWAVSLGQAGRGQEAVAVWSNYLEHAHSSENRAAALGNRASQFWALGRRTEALADHEASIALHPIPNALANYAEHLIALGRKGEALQRLRESVALGPDHPRAHDLLADLCDPHEALEHRRLAVKHAWHEDQLRQFLPPLAALEEQLGEYAAAIAALRQLIDLSPTHRDVPEWRRRIAAARRGLEEEEEKRSARERLARDGTLPPQTLLAAWLEACRARVLRFGGAWLEVELRRGEAPIPVLLLLEPELQKAGLERQVKALPEVLGKAERLLLVTAATEIRSSARGYIADSQASKRVGLLTLSELGEALRQGDAACAQLLTRAFQRAGKPDPFAYKGVVQDSVEFFGRSEELAKIVGHLRAGEPLGLYGIHKIGKSSLLEQVRRRLPYAPDEITVVKVELDSSLRDVTEVYERICRALPEAGGMPTTAAGFRDRLVGYQERASRRQPGHRLLLLLDEYPHLLPDRYGRHGVPGFLDLLSVLKVLTQEGWLLPLPCGRTAVLSNQASFGDRENPFVDQLFAHYLNPLTRAEADDLLQVTARRAAVRFSLEALDAMFEATAGHPGLTRDLAHLIHEQRPPKGDIRPEHVALARQAILRDRHKASILRAIYEERMDDDQQDIARQVALAGVMSRRDLVRPSRDRDRQRLVQKDERVRGRERLAAIDDLVATTVLVADGDLLHHRYGVLRDLIRLEAELLPPEGA